MKRSISIIGSILLAAALTSPAWAHPGNGKGGGQGGGGSGGSGGSSGGESQAGGLPGLEDRVEADEALIATLQTQVATLMSEVTALQTAVTTLQGQVSTLNTEVGDLEGQNNFALVDETTTTCTLGASHSSAGPVSASFFSNGVCLVTFAKNVSLCSSVASLAGGVGGEIAVSPTTKTITGDTIIVSTFDPAGTAAASDFNLTVTCP
jgi:hypothetical protein